MHTANHHPHRIVYLGTDLGWTYEHKDELKILFGDTIAKTDETPIEASSGDTFYDALGSVYMTVWNQPENVYDIIDQVSVAWVPQLSRWLQF